MDCPHVDGPNVDGAIAAPPLIRFGGKVDALSLMRMHLRCTQRNADARLAGVITRDCE